MPCCLSFYSNLALPRDPKPFTLWIISTLVASNWSQIRFFILANVLRSITEKSWPNFDQIIISSIGGHFLHKQFANLTKQS